MKLAVMMVASVALHLLVGWGLAGERPRETKRAPVELEIAEAKPPPPPPPVVPSASPREAAPRRRAARPMVAAADAPVAADEPPVAVPSASEPVDLTDDAPIAAAVPVPVVVSAPAVDHSRPPAPPVLDDVLARQGVRSGGTAVVRVRIGLSGKAEVLTIVSASAPELGEACRATVHGSRWRVALDRAGAPVVREVSYRCAFELGGW